MQTVTLGNRPATIAAMTKLVDFSDGDTHIRVSVRLLNTDKPDTLVLDAQAFQVDAAGAMVCADDGRPSRSPGSQHTVAMSSLSDTHTLKGGWVRDTGAYTAENFGPDAVHGSGKPGDSADAAQPYFDDASGIGYRWDDGETMRVARGKAEELLRIIANSGALLGASF